MFKRSLASLAAVAVAVASGAVVAPANAITVKFNNKNMTCTIEQNDKEVQLTSVARTVTLKKKGGAHLKASIVDSQLSTLRAGIEKDEMELAKLAPNAAGREKLMSELNKKKEKLTAYQNLSNALEACDAGKDYNSDQPSVPKRPEGSDQPGVPKPPSVPKEPEGSDQPGVPKPPSVPKEPEDSVKPDDKRALPSNNGAVIGVIVAVLGILAAALPVIKSILRALLP
ncbi:hypothetical protein [Corynebacterium diphtheriae]|uniref:hypothetical protein n=1 Tax=Corynebacterium diphtheriae TaxID=1717 RepID=UPI000B4AEC0B|nr:hypothetical protein [Corynebacterium diphtheriae]OWM49329.1 hypothetical protein BU161_03690 [Corynebacterium diphtheriae]